MSSKCHLRSVYHLMSQGKKHGNDVVVMKHIQYSAKPLAFDVCFDSLSDCCIYEVKVFKNNKPIFMLLHVCNVIC